MTINYEVIFYQNEDGNSPLRSWLSSLRDGRASVFIDRRIRRLMSGNFGDCKSLNHGLYELRIDYGPGYRIYYCREGTRLILLLCGGDKRTQAADIERARDYKKDYERRMQ